MNTTEQRAVAAVGPFDPFNNAFGIDASKHWATDERHKLFWSYEGQSVGIHIWSWCGKHLGAVHPIKVEYHEKRLERAMCPRCAELEEQVAYVKNEHDVDLLENDENLYEFLHVHQGVDFEPLDDDE